MSSSLDAVVSTVACKSIHKSWTFSLFSKDEHKLEKIQRYIWTCSLFLQEYQICLRKQPSGHILSKCLPETHSFSLRLLILFLGLSMFCFLNIQYIRSFDKPLFYRSILLQLKCPPPPNLLHVTTDSGMFLYALKYQE